MTLIKLSLLLIGCFLIGWVSYWAGFSKSLEIELYINQSQDFSRATEYDEFVAKLDSGKVGEVRSALKDWSDILKKESSLQGSETNSISDLLIPIGGVSLVRNYNARRVKERQLQRGH